MTHRPARSKARFQVTTLGLLKLTVFVAACLGWIVPLFASKRSGTLSELLRIVLLPLVAAALVRVLMRSGPLRAWCVASLLFVPFLLSAFAAWGVSLMFLANGLWPIFVSLPVAVLLTWVYYPWLNRLIPARCPACRSWSLLDDPGFPPTERANPFDPVYGCVACGGHYQEAPAGRWLELDGLGSKPSSSVLASADGRPASGRRSG